MKQTGIRWGVLMQLARRGGMSGLSIILPGQADGYVQAIRGKNIPAEAQAGDSASSFVNAGRGFERQAIQVDPCTETLEVEMEVRNYAAFSADESHSGSKPFVVNEDTPAQKKADDPSP